MYIVFVLTVSIHPNKERTLNVRAVNLCQRKDWDFHRFACSVVAKKSDTESLNSLPQEPVHIC